MNRDQDSLPLVSVCMPAYNAAEHIADSVRSVLQQTYPRIELVICNDGSTDETAAVLEQFAGYDQLVVVHTANGGQCAAANEAFRHSRGELIKFFDADDLLNPTHIEVQVNRLAGRPDCIAAGQLSRFYGNDPASAGNEPRANWLDLKPLDWLLAGNGDGLGMMQCGMFLIPRNLLLKAGLWNESLSQINDFEFFPRVFLEAAEMLFTPEARVLYRSGSMSSLSNNLSPAKLLSAYQALTLTTERLLRIEDSERVRSALSHYWSLWIHNFFLEDRALYRGAQQRLQQLGNFPDDYYERSAGTLARLIGWRNKKRIRYGLRRIRRCFGK